MLKSSNSPDFDPSKEVIKLILDVNRKYYPTFPSVMYVSELNLDYAIIMLSGLDYSAKMELNLSDEEYEKTWIAYGVRAKHTTNPNYFGVNGDTFHYKWRKQFKDV